MVGNESTFTLSILRHLIVDLDGTLVVCGRYYLAANDDVADALASHFGLDKALVRELIEFTDVWAIRAAKEGFKKERFPRSLAAVAGAVQMICHPDGWIYPSVMEWALHRGEQVFDFEKSPYEPFVGALETLQLYKDHGWHLWVCTKGDEPVQVEKITRHGIDKLVDGWRVVSQKNPEVLRQFCEELHIPIDQAIYVGDSVRDDITPAKALGMRAVRVATMPEDHWVHDTAPDTLSDALIDSFRDLPTVVPVG